MGPKPMRWPFAWTGGERLSVLPQMWATRLTANSVGSLTAWARCLRGIDGLAGSGPDG
jgi:hypothetical protein